VDDRLERLALCAALPKATRETSDDHAAFRVRRRTLASFCPVDWDEVADSVTESYLLVAVKRLAGPVEPRL
jgi:hypothetical protein